MLAPSAAARTGFELDVDTFLSPTSQGRYSGELSERWNVGVGMNGGYLAVFCLRAVLAESTLPDPLSMTVHFLSRPRPGPAEVHLRALRLGRGHATYSFDLVQGSDIRVTGLALTGRRRQAGRLDFAPSRPLGPGPDESTPLSRCLQPGGHAPLWDRLETRVASPDDVFFLRSEAGQASTGGWTRLGDGRPTGALCVPLFLDCWPPAVFSRTMRPDAAGAPTLELTVHWRNWVPTGWLRARFHSGQFAGGYVEEDGELWSQDGSLVAQSRQLARYDGRGEIFGR